MWTMRFTTMTVRGHSFSPTFPPSILPPPLLPSVSPLYNIPQWHLQSSLNISEHLQALHWVPLYLLLFLSSILSFSFPISLSDRLWDGLYLQPLCLFLFSSMFILCLFLSSFPMLLCLTFHFQGLSFPFTYSHRLPPSRSLSFSLRISC